MPNVKELEELLQKELGFKPVEKHEVERLESAVKTGVVEPVSRRIREQQEKLERARAWPIK